MPDNPQNQNIPANQPNPQQQMMDQANLMGAPVHPKKTASLFGSKPPPLPTKDIQNLTTEVADSVRRVRVMEERYNNLRKKVQLIEQDMIEFKKKVLVETKTFLSEVDEIKDTVHKFQDKMDMMIKELRLTARKEDVEIIKKYLDYWEPIKFITIEQCEKMIKEFMENSNV